MNISSNNITLRNHNSKSKNDESKEKNEPQETIKTATFVDVWKIKQFREILPVMSISHPINSPKFTHSFNESSIHCVARMYTLDLYGGLIVIETFIKGAETGIAKVQCFLRNVKGEEIHLSTSQREDTRLPRFKHVTQPKVVLNENNGLIPKDVLTVVLKIQITISQDYKSIKDARLADDLGSLLESGSFSDVTFLVDGHSIKAHKGILACRSAAFASLFHEEPCDVVEITNLDVGVVKEMLSFCYTGWVDKISLDLLRASEEFDIVGLKIVCEDHLSRRLSVDNAATVLVCAENCHAPTLKKKAMKFVAEHLKETVSKSKFKSISYPTILEILQMWSAL